MEETETLRELNSYNMLLFRIPEWLSEAWQARLRITLGLEPKRWTLYLVVLSAGLFSQGIQL